MRGLALVAAALLTAVAAGAQNAEAAKKKAPKTRGVLFVGNNWDGSADVIGPRKFRRVARLNIIPDHDERMAEIMSDPADYGYFLGIRQLVGEGHDQFVDDMFSSRNGRLLFVSRPSFRDVVAISFRTRKIVWRVKVDGNRADHMGISRDGSSLLVSASTAKVIDAKTYKVLKKIDMLGVKR